MPNASALSTVSAGAVIERNRAAQTMALRVGETGSGLYLAEVETYQQVWNATRLATQEQARIAGLSATQADRITPILEEDGQFGPHTSATLCVIVGDPCPPQRATGMPVWVAQNHDRIMALVPPGSPPVEELITPDPGNIAPPANNAPPPSTGSGATVFTVPDEVSSPPPGPPEVVYYDRPAEEDVVEADAEAVLPASYVDFTDEPGNETPIVTTRPVSRVPWVAVLLGAAGLGGTFWLYQYGGKRRRRA